MKRPNWDETCMEMVTTLMKRATCLYHQVGCVLLSPDKTIVGTGYNGPPKGFPHCTDIGCNKDKGGNCVGSHAEMNALIFCVGSPYQTLSAATLYISVFPCNQCIKQLVNTGIKRIVFLEWYRRRHVEEGKNVTEPSDGAIEIAKTARIAVDMYNIETHQLTEIKCFSGFSPAATK